MAMFASIHCSHVHLQHFRNFSFGLFSVFNGTKYPYIHYREFQGNGIPKRLNSDIEISSCEKTSETIHTEDRTVANNNCVDSINKIKWIPGLREQQSRIDQDNGRKRSASEVLTEHSRKQKVIVPSKYFKSSWLKHYSSTTDKKCNYIRSESLKEDRKQVNQNFKTAKLFGCLNMETGVNYQRQDQRHSNERFKESIPEDSDDKRDHRLDIPLTRYGRINKKNYYYNRKMSLLGQQGKIKEAIAVFEELMMIRDRVKPSKRTFVTLIGILGRVGYAKKAFELFGKMKQFKLDPVDHIYTSLFNACSNSPAVDDGLKRAEYLLIHLKEKGIVPNLFTVKAAMKAFAMCGDFPKAFTLLDEASMKFQLDLECFNHLLIACISDKEAGFRRALQVWQKMGKYKVQPDIHTFNLLLRSLRDCSLGSLTTFLSDFGFDENNEICKGSDFLDFQCSQRRLIGEKNSSKICTDTFNNSKDRSDVNLKMTGTDMIFPDSAKLKQQDASLYADLDVWNKTKFASDYDITYPRNMKAEDIPFITNDIRGNSREDTLFEFSRNDRHFLNYSLGEKNNSSSSINVKDTPRATPLVTNRNDTKSLYADMVTEFTHNLPIKKKLANISLKDLKFPFGRLLLLGGASRLVSFMESMGCHPEVKTFSQILACIPNDEQSEFELLKLMEERNLKPDIDFLNDVIVRRNRRRKGDSARAVLKVISKLKLAPNMRTYSAIALTCQKEKDALEILQDMKEANLEPNVVIIGHLIHVSGCNYTYKLKMLQTMESLALQPTKENIAVIEKSIMLTKMRIIEVEKKKDTTSFYLSDSFQRSFQYFLRYYNAWLIRVQLAKSHH